MKQKNTNENCLKGLACPKCSSFGPFSIDCQAFFDVSDDGTENARDVRWDKDSAAVCHGCEFTGTVKDFEAPAIPKKCPNCNGETEWANAETKRVHCLFCGYEGPEA